MKLSKVNGHYQDQILLVEAPITTTKNNIRTVKNVYSIRIYKSTPYKEVYIFHT
jgi:hypothetical protein